MALEIPLEVARRFVLGKQGLWPGRRWQGLEGAEQAMRAIEQLQLDPLVLLARAHDLILHARVLDYRQGDWATLTYEQRKFFDWGGWLAVRPMDELPHWRVLMRRELDQPNWIEFQREHGPAIAEMRDVLAERGTVSNREFAAGTRARIDNYRGRKDSSLALHFLWRIGDAMIFRRDGFERVYALTEAVAPPELIRESDPDVADDYLMTKLVGADGLAPMRTVGNFMRRKVTPAELASWRQGKLDAGELLEVRVEGWRAPQVALAADEPPPGGPPRRPNAERRRPRHLHPHHQERLRPHPARPRRPARRLPLPGPDLPRHRPHRRQRLGAAPMAGVHTEAWIPVSYGKLTGDLAGVPVAVPGIAAPGTTPAPGQTTTAALAAPAFQPTNPIFPPSANAPARSTSAGCSWATTPVPSPRSATARSVPPYFLAPFDYGVYAYTIGPYGDLKTPSPTSPAPSRARASPPTAA